VGLVKAVVQKDGDERQSIDSGNDRQTDPDAVNLAKGARDRALIRNHFARAIVKMKEIILFVGDDPTVYGDDRNDAGHGN
jgi:hypothetical protein